jgi:hypothetical protein
MLVIFTLPPISTEMTEVKDTIEPSQSRHSRAHSDSAPPASNAFTPTYPDHASTGYSGTSYTRILPPPSYQGNFPGDSFEEWASHRQTGTNWTGPLELSSHPMYMRTPSNTDGMRAELGGSYQSSYHRATPPSYFGLPPEEFEAASALAALANPRACPPVDGVRHFQDLQPHVLDAPTAPAPSETDIPQADTETEEEEVEGHPLSKAQFLNRARNGGVTFVGKEQPRVPGKIGVRYAFVPLERRITNTNLKLLLSTDRTLHSIEAGSSKIF